MIDIKCTIVGDPQCGKSTMIRCFADSFVPNSGQQNINGTTPQEPKVDPNVGPNSVEQTTIGPSGQIDKYSIKLQHLEKEIFVEFWDVDLLLRVSSLHSPGNISSEHRNIAYQESDCFLLCFSVGEPSSLRKHIETWLDELRNVVATSSIFLVGCKTDLRNGTQPFTTKKQGQEVAQKFSLLTYVECSSQNKDSIKEMFDDIITTLLLRHKQELVEEEEQDDFDFMEDALVDDRVRQEEPVAVSNIELPTPTTPPQQHLVAAEPTPVEEQLPENNIIIDDLDGEKLPPRKTVEDEILSTFMNAVNGPPSVPKERESLQSLLKREANIEDMLVETVRAEFLTEFRYRNKAVVEYMTRRETLIHLIDILIKGEKPAQELFCINELLTADIPAIFDVFCDTTAPLWDNMFRFFSTPRSPNSSFQSVSMFVRVLSFYISNRQIEFTLYIKERPKVIEGILNMIGNDCIVSLLLAMLECEHSLDILNIQLRWTNQLVPVLGKKLEATCSPGIETDLSGIADFIEQAISRYPSSAFIEEVQSPLIVKPLLANAFDEKNPYSMAYVIVLLKFLPLCKNKGEYETAQLPQLFVEILQQPQNTNTSDGLKSGERPLQRLFKLLHKAPSLLPPSITTSCGIIAPLGHFRLNCVCFVAGLLKSNYHLVDTALIEHRLISRVVDLFFQFKWNNTLHGLVESMVFHILETKPSFFCLYLLRDCCLVDRILQAQQNDEQEKKMKTKREQGIPHQGYMGHLTNISNAIIRSSKVHSAIFYLLEDIPSRAWRKYEEKLKMVNQIRSTPVGGPAPERKTLRKGQMLVA